MEAGYIIGWFGVGFGLLVPIPQLLKLRNDKGGSVAVGTYGFLICCLICYLLHAIYLGAEVFVAAQSINLLTNSTIFGILIRRRLKAKRTGCTMCGFGIHMEKRPHRFDRLRASNYKEWHFWMYDKGWGKVLSYIGVEWENYQESLI